jgi:hypothetical protein
VPTPPPIQGSGQASPGGSAQGAPAPRHKSKGLSAGAIVLVAFASIFGLSGVVVGLVFLQRFLRRKRRNDHARAFDLLFDSGDELEEEMEKGRL